jgi:hypothetical protein
MMSTDRGSATIALSMIGALATGAPVVSALIFTSDNVSNTLTFIVTLLVGLGSIGFGIGRIYGRWRDSITASIKRDELLADLCERVQRIEERQVHIMEVLDKR